MSRFDFWNGLRAEFLALSESAKARQRNVEAHDWDIVVAGDPDLRFQMTQLATRGGLALGAEPGVAVNTWIDAVRDLLERQRSDRLVPFSLSSWEAPPTEIHKIPMQRIHCDVGDDSEAASPPGDLLGFVLSRGDLPELLIVLPSGSGYRVMDDPRERAKYHACQAAGLAEVTCGVREPENLGRSLESEYFDVRRLEVASADLCMEQATLALGAERGPWAESARANAPACMPPEGATEIIASPPDTHALPATWADVEIAFTSDTRVQVTVKGHAFPSWNYAEMGFENRKTQTPNLAWYVLKELAEKQGSIPVPLKQRKAIEKRIQEIRRTLRAHFATQGIRIPPESELLAYARPERTYRAAFQVGTRKSFHL